MAGSRAWGQYQPPEQRGERNYASSRAQSSHNKGDARGKGKRRELPEKDQEGLDLLERVQTGYTPHPALEAHLGDSLRAQNLIEIHDLDTNRECLEDVDTPIYKICFAPFEDAIRDQLQRRYHQPTPIQMQAWPLLMRGWDLLGVAPTGSGKTLCYLLPLLEHVKVQPSTRPHDGCIALILLPSKELCQQVAKEAENWSKYSGLTCRVMTCSKDDKNLPERGQCEILCASAGKLGSLLKERRYCVLRASFVVVDEADKLLFENSDNERRDTEMTHPLEILNKSTRRDKQIAMFTATWDDKDVARPEFRGLLKRGLRVRVDSSELKGCKDVLQDFWCPGYNDDPNEDCWELNETREQAFVKAVRCMCFPEDCEVPAEEKAIKKVLVFVNAYDKPHERVNHLVQVLEESHILEPGEVAGFVRQERWQSDEAFMNFKDENKPSPRVLITTDVLARGFDCPSCAFVLNYEMPTGKNALLNYVHRIGRTGRGGREGASLALLDEADLRFARDLVSMAKLNEHPVPKWLQDVAQKGVGKYWHMWRMKKEQQQLTSRGDPMPNGEAPPELRSGAAGRPPLLSQLDMPFPDFQSEERTKNRPL